MLRPIALLLVYHTICASCVDLVVQTRLGEVRGVRSEEGEHVMFMGVPYAVVDEENPFGASKPHPGYPEPILAYNDDTVCPQSRRGVPTGTLQCLVLNIFVPDTPDDISSLPVMVWIYGGAWVEGNANRGLNSPNFLVRHGVIVVNVSYRVGMYGYMCTDSPKAPGNNGLKDQLLAFRWIKEHIDSFGGDPSRVTAFGESAGGMAVHLHLLSHHEKLFERAIIQSGASSSPWTIVDQNNDVPIKVASALGFDTEDLDEAIDFISKANVYDVVRAAAELRFATAENNNQPVTKACVEREFEGTERFVTVHSNIAHSYKAKDVDVLIGHNSEEMIFQYGNRPSEFFDSYSFKELLAFGFDVTDFDNMASLLRRFYIRDEATSPHLEQDITRFASDFVWNHPTERAIKLLLEDNARVLYQYKFSYVGGRNFLRANINTTVPGAAHADELGYIFDMTIFKQQEDTPEDLRVVDQITTMWTNFVKYANPTPEITDLLPVKWEPVTGASQPYLDIDSELTTSHRPFHDRMTFWDLFYETNRDKAKGFSDHPRRLRDGGRCLSSFTHDQSCDDDSY